ncbi:hypothetical protein ACWF95_38955 [Streptomyces vinaceus]
MDNSTRPITWLARWVFSPVTTRRADRLMAACPAMDAETAWRIARVADHPDEAVYLHPKDD